MLSVATNLLCINYWVILSYISKDIMFIIYIEFILFSPNFPIFIFICSDDYVGLSKTSKLLYNLS